MRQELDSTTIRRNQDFCNVFDKVLREFPDIPIEDAINIAIHSPAREFYVSENYAIRYCYAMKARKPSRLKKGTAKYLCFTTIYYTARNKANREEITLREAIIKTIYSTAPRFYINRSTAYTILKNTRR